MISDIKIPLDDYEVLRGKKPQNYISDLSKVNIFVGANNSGKSRFMRELVSCNVQFQTKEHREKINKLEELKRNFDVWLGDKKKLLPETEPLNIFARTKSLTYLRSNSNLISFYASLTKQIKINLAGSYTNYGGGLSTRDIASYLNNYILEHNFDNLFIDEETKNYKFVYIPILRGLRNLVAKQNNNIEKESTTSFEPIDCYMGRTIFDYFNNASSNSSDLINFKDKFEIFTGLTLYETIKDMQHGPLVERNFIKDFEKFLSEKFFDGNKINLIPRKHKDILYLKIGNQEERPIYDLGDGLQTIIIASFPLFKYQNENLLLFVEEPELALHPGLQRKLLNTYCNEFPNTQIFITTHSNHLLDITLDFNGKTSIYSFEKKIDEKFKIENITPNKQILDMLGVRNSSVFLSNCVIWVEGITDRLYIKKYMKLYYDSIELKDKSHELDSKQKKLRIYEEDKHYSILEYSGGNITHFNFDENDSDNETININSISKNNFLIADNDGFEKYDKPINDDTDKKHKRLRLFYEFFGDHFFAEHREVENLVPFRIYQKYFVDLKENKNRKWESDKSKLCTPNKFNLTEDTFDECIKNTAIGTLLKKHFIKLKDGIQSNEFKEKDISCIGNKKDIAQKLITVMDTENLKFDELPKIAQKLIIKLSTFIHDNNKE